MPEDMAVEEEWSGLVKDETDSGTSLTSGNGLYEVKVGKG